MGASGSCDNLYKTFQIFQLNIFFYLGAGIFICIIFHEIYT